MPDSILHESMRQGVTFFFFVFICCLSVCLFFLFFFVFLRGDNSVFLRMKEMESVLSL